MKSSKDCLFYCFFFLHDDAILVSLLLLVCLGEHLLLVHAHGVLEHFWQILLCQRGAFDEPFRADALLELLSLKRATRRQMVMVAMDKEQQNEREKFIFFFFLKETRGKIKCWSFFDVYITIKVNSNHDNNKKKERGRKEKNILAFWWYSLNSILSGVHRACFQPRQWVVRFYPRWISSLRDTTKQKGVKM